LGYENRLPSELKFVALIDKHGFGNHKVIGVIEVSFHVPAGELLMAGSLGFVGEEDSLLWE